MRRREGTINVRFLSGIVCLLVLLPIACAKTPPTSAPKVKQAIAKISLGTGERSVEITAEIARTPEERAQGLMFRRYLPPMEGMYFIFEKQAVQSFWMKNTYIPLDMIFIDETMRVVGILESVEPETTTTRHVTSPSKYVLEVNAGFAQKWGISIGTPVTVSDLKSNP